MREKELTAHLDGKACYAALRAHDARFDGRFFVGVSSTMIYCRPVCHAKLPREENCTFFVSAAAAEAAGYRPCRRCRPELSPGLSPTDSSSRMAKMAAIAIEESCFSELKISELASKIGITDRHLRRIFYKEYGVSPIRFIQTGRLLLAKRLLSETELPFAEVAMSSGFGSIRRFNALFKKHYKLTPSEFKRPINLSPRINDAITLLQAYRPPYAWNELVEFLATRAIPGIESAEAGVYRRTVAIKEGKMTHYGWISVENKPEKNALSVMISCSLLPVMPKVLSRIRCLFDVDCSPTEIYDRLCTMNRISPGMCILGLRLPGCFDPFEMSVRAVLGQQVTVKSARTLAKRFAETFGEKVSTPFAELNYTFPTPESISALEPPVENSICPLGIISARARSLYALAGAIEAGAISLSHGAEPGREMEKLLHLPGFGPWTVQYISMRALGWPDAFPHTDYGVKKALSGMTQSEILHLSEDWKPWRSYATVNLWNYLSKITKN